MWPHWDVVVGIGGSAVITSLFWWVAKRAQGKQYREAAEIASKRHREEIENAERRHAKAMKRFDLQDRELKMARYERRGWTVVYTPDGDVVAGFDNDTRLGLGSELTVEINPDKPNENA